MAITLRGTVSGGSNGADLTLNLPVGTAAGDLVIAAYCMSTSTDSDIDMQMVTNGYTEVADLFANDSREANFGVFWKLMGGSPDATAVFKTSPGLQDLGGFLIVLSGVDQANPIDVASTTATGINSNIPDPPSITPVTNGAWVIALGGNSNGGSTPTAPSGYSNMVFGDSIGNDCCAMAATKLLSTAAAENPGVFGSITTDTTQAWCAVAVAVRPEAPGNINLGAAVADTYVSTINAAAASTMGAAMSDSYVAHVITAAAISLGSGLADAHARAIGTVGSVTLDVRMADQYAAAVRAGGAVGLGLAAADAYARSVGVGASLALGVGAAVTPVGNIAAADSIDLDVQGVGPDLASDFIDYAASLPSRRPSQPPPEVPNITPRRSGDGTSVTTSRRPSNPGPETPNITSRRTT